MNQAEQDAKLLKEVVEQAVANNSDAEVLSNLLGKTKNPAAIPHLTQLAENCDHISPLWNIAHALLYIGTPECVSAFLKLAKHPENFAREAIVCVFHTHPSEYKPIFDPVLAELVHDPVSYIRDKVLQILIRQRITNYASLLEHFIQDSSEHVRIALAREVSSLKDKEALHFLDQLARDTGTMVRMQVAASLASIRTAQSHDLLTHLAQDDFEPVRDTAKASLETLCVPA